MGELHLEIIVDRLTREFKVDARGGGPRCPTGKPSPSPPGPKGALCARAAAGANTAMSGWWWSP
jgi:hypothetical protein